MGSIFVIFGATGDLMTKKLVPALYELYRKKMLPPLFQIVGFSRREITPAEFQKQIEGIITSGAKDVSHAAAFAKLFTYTQGVFDSKEAYQSLAEYLGRKDGEWRLCSNKLFYLAVPPEHYGTIFENLKGSGLTIPCSPEEGWTRVIVEKPFGKDLKTAEALDRQLGNLFKEEQIYRIDHYLGKETVENILAFRFSNSFLAPAWNRENIESIHLAFFEKDGVEHRGEFYDSVGALRDVGQNHLLQLLALLTMEAPAEFTADGIRHERERALASLRAMSPEEVRQDTMRGQYAGYESVKGVRPGSETETYFKIKTTLDAGRFEGVPVVLEGGKALGEDRVEAVITFRHSSPCLCPPGIHSKNTLHYEIKPQEGIRMSFWVKRPGAEMKIEEKDFSFDYAKAYPKEEFLDAYEKLLLNVIRGDQALFVSTAEIAASWKFIDRITEEWEKGAPPLRRYEPGCVDVE